MRKLRTLTVLALVIAGLPALAADVTAGTWKLNLSKSTYSPGPMPLSSYTQVREAVPNGMKVTITGARNTSETIDCTYTVKFDGRPVPVIGTGTPYNMISAKHVDAGTITAEGTNTANKYRVAFRSVVSKDGKSMTTTGKGAAGDGTPVSLMFVFEKQ